MAVALHEKWSLAVLFLFTLAFVRYPTAASGLAAGVVYGRLGDNLPPPTQVVRLMQGHNIKSTMIYDTDQTVLQAFMGSNITIIVQAPNSVFPSLAMGQDAATAWVQANIIPYASVIRYISIGNEVLTSDPGLGNYLLPAMSNVYNALRQANLHTSIKLSTTHAANVLDASSFPPSNGNFNSSMLTQLGGILQFLSATGGPFMANVYPFLAYIGSTDGTINLSYALFQLTSSNSAMVQDMGGGGLIYTNIFDAQVDTFIYAMERSGYGNVSLVVTETGWASSGDPAATVENAHTYNGNLVRHIAANGTPKRPNSRLETYIFALFNEDQKTGAEHERHFGLFNPDQTEVYDMPY